MAISTIDNNGANLGQLGNRNLIINGSMIIDQRNGGASVTPGNGTLTLDRWKAGLAQTSKFSLDQDSESPAGFTTSMKVTSLTAYTPSSNDHFFIEQEVEGYNAIPLALGSSDAKDISISFWVRSSLTGTFAGSVINSARNKSRVFEYTINTANTWEHKTVSFVGDTTGTWLTTSGKGLSLRFSFGAAGTWLQDAGSWSTGNVTASSGSVNLVATNNATLYITGVQLEVGDTATPFEHRSYGEELLACKRYFQRIAGGESGITNSAIMTGVMHNSTFVEGIYKMEVEMRTEPSLECVTGTDYYGFSRNGAQDTFNSISIDAGVGNPRQVNLYNGTEVSGTAGQGGIVFSKVEAAIVSLSAEL